MRGRIGWAVAILIGVATVQSGQADDSSSAAATQGSQRASRAHRNAQTGIEARLKTYTRVLGLDADQQSQLRALLIQQGEQLRGIWSDSSLPSGKRVQASRAVADLTADRIRAVLTEEQRKKYNGPRTPHENTMRGARVEDWMNAVAEH